MAVARTIEELRKILRQELNETDKTTRLLAEETGISKTHLINFRNETGNISFENLHILAEYFGVKYVLKN